VLGPRNEHDARVEVITTQDSLFFPDLVEAGAKHQEAEEHIVYFTKHAVEKDRVGCTFGKMDSAILGASLGLCRLAVATRMFVNVLILATPRVSIFVRTCTGSNASNFSLVHHRHASTI
jgi:hypothetical protein